MANASPSARDQRADARGATTTAPLLSVRDLRVNFRLDKQTDFAAVKGISFDVPHNATVALVGESGSGKSVTSLSILGSLPRENATILPGSANSNTVAATWWTCRQSELRALRGKDISMIFQEPMTSLNPVFTVGFQLVESLRLHLGLSPAAARKRAIELLVEVGIPDPKFKINAYPSQMSGGQQQRVMIAMAIACEPKLLIADEPTTALDVTIQKQILDLIAELQRKHRMSVLFITHDLAVVGEIADYVVVMRNGEIREQGPAKAVFENPQDPYTKALLQCRPRLDRRPVRLPVIEDFMDGGAHAMNLTERTRGITAGRPDHPRREGPRQEFLFPRRRVRPAQVRGGEGCLVQAAEGQDTGPCRRIGFRQDDRRADPDAPARGVERAGVVRRQGYPGDVAARVHGVQAPHPDHFPEPVRIAESAHDRRPDPDRADADPRHQAVPTQERTDLAFELLHKVGLAEVSFYKYPHEFSGGQRQRIAIARCLTLKPDILICDESVSALDVSVQAQVLNLLQDLQDEFHLSYIFIRTTSPWSSTSADEIMVMNQGEIVEIANSDDIYRNPRQPYTRKLLQRSRRAGIRASIEGQSVNVISLTTAPGSRMLPTLRAR